MGDGIKTICGWCGILISNGPLDAAGRASHGICASCKTKVLDDFAQQTLKIAINLRFSALGASGVAAKDATEAFAVAMKTQPTIYAYGFGSPWMTGDVIDQAMNNDWTPDGALNTGRLTPEPPGRPSPARKPPDLFKPAPEPHTRKIELDEDE